MPTLLLSLDISVLYLALPALSADLGVTSTQQLWISDIYSFMIAGFLVVMGSLGDRVGRRKLLLAGGAAFAACSALAAYASSPEMLIVSRALLGIAGATLMPSTMALIRTLFPDPAQMAVALSIWFSCFMGGMTIGPLVGGVLLEHFWWGSAFLLGVPVMVLLLVLGPVLLPEHREDTAPGRLDLASAGLCVAAILPVIYGLKEIARDGVSIGAVVAMAAGLALGVAFVRRQRRLADPLLDLRLFANRRFTVSLTAFLLTGVVMAGVSFAAAQYMQLVLGLSPLEAGLWLIPSNVAMVAATLIAPRLLQRHQAADLLAGGLAVSGAGLLLLTLAGTDSLGLQVTAMTVAAAGIGVPMAVVTNLILAAAPPERAGSAASLSETAGEFGIALGIASLGSVTIAVYSGRVGELLPAGTPSSLTAAAQESLAAVTSADGAGAAVLEAARTAFTSGFNVVGGIGGAVLLLVAVVARLALREK
ncbi:MFS transporter [Jiangella mangrovi]